jgi:hypothetical protein
VVRDHHVGGDGDGADPSSGGVEHLRHQPDRAGYRAGADHLGDATVRDPDGDRGGDPVRGAGDRDVAAECGLWGVGVLIVSETGPPGQRLR